MKTFFSKKRIIIGSAIIVAIGVIWFSFFRTKAVQQEVVTAERTSLEKIVSVTGKVQARDSVDLSFEKSGKVSVVHTDVGKRVVAGTVLVELDHADLAAQRAEAEAGLAVQEAKLQEMKQGTRVEEIVIAQASVAAAQQAFNDANTGLAAVQNKAVVDMNEKYDAALTAIAKSINVVSGSLYTLTDIQLKYFSDNSQESITIADAKADATMMLFGAQNGGRLTNDAMGSLSGGAKGLVMQAQSSHAPADIEQALLATEQALTAVKGALNAVPVNAKLTSTETANIQTEKNNIAGEIVTVAAKNQAIAVQKATNESATTTAQTSVNAAGNALTSARVQLALKQAGATQEQIAAQEATVVQAQANVQSVKAQLAKTFLIAPIGGVVTRQDAKIGQIVGINIPIVSLISDAGFEIEARIPEADIAAVKLGDPAHVTLDAYGNKVIFETKVIAIDPAETVVEGVATYKTTFAFIEKDERIKSGMTANIDAITDRRDDVVVVPRHSIMGSGDDATVSLVESDGTTHTVKVKTGLVGSDGNVEITDGVKEGDRVVLSPAQ